MMSGFRLGVDMRQIDFETMCTKMEKAREKKNNKGVKALFTEEQYTEFEKMRKDHMQLGWSWCFQQIIINFSIHA